MIVTMILIFNVITFFCEIGGFICYVPLWMLKDTHIKMLYYLIPQNC